jgi:hypothetical protein
MALIFYAGKRSVKLSEERFKNGHGRIRLERTCSSWSTYVDIFSLRQKSYALQEFYKIKAKIKKAYRRDELLRFRGKRA